jgi:hypothetical protein
MSKKSSVSARGKKERTRFNFKAKKGAEKMEGKKRRYIFASLAGGLWMLLIVGFAFAQEAPAPAAGESAKLEPLAGPTPAAPEAKKEDPGAAAAQFTQGLLDQIGGAKVAMDTMWTLLAGMLVFFMNLALPPLAAAPDF